MRLISTIILLLFWTQLTHSQQRIHIDEKGDTISETLYQKKWRNKGLLLSAWHHKDKKGIHYQTLKKDLYLKGIFDYGEIKRKIEEITDKKVPDSTTLLIKYFFKDDLCNRLSDNNWNKSKISKRKSYTNSQRKKLFKKGIFLILLFEPGIKLKNKPEDKNEYYYLDEESFFRKKLFINPTLCGSYALIKNNGECIVRNGENRADSMAKHLEPEKWNVFFKNED